MHIDNGNDMLSWHVEADSVMHALEQFKQFDVVDFERDVSFVEINLHNSPDRIEITQVKP